MKKILVILLSLVLVTGCSSKIFNNSKVNNNENIIKEQTFGNLVINNISLVYEKGVYTFKFTLTNNGDKANVSKLNITFKNENDSVITTLDGSFGEIDANTSLDMVLTSDIDLSNAYKVEYEL